MTDVRDNIERVREQVRSACLRSHRSAQDVHVVAVSKTVPTAKIRQAINAGLRVMGENRVQEATAKIAEIGPGVVWHLVGHLQQNKVRHAVELFTVIESVDSIALARALSQRATQLQRVLQVMLEVNTSGEASKFGVQPEQAVTVAKEISVLENIRLTGLMTVGALVADPQEARPCFRMLSELRDDMRRQGLALEHLSMGMSNDFEQAIEEGATLIRLGRALFGERN